MISLKTKEFLEGKARGLKRDVMTMLFEAQSGHPGGSLSLAEIMSVLYFHDLNYDQKNPKEIGRDRVILSKGHAAPILYVTLAEAGFFDKSELSKLRRTGALLQGHPCLNIPGVDMTTGSLGLGLSGACGMAIAAKRIKKDNVRIYAILGDGELGEGQIWEAGMAAPHFKLDNLTAMIDRNRYQNDGATADILSTEPLADKWMSFGWNTIEVDGHDVMEIASAFENGRETKDKPTMLIMNTVKGHGVDYLIDKPGLHYAAPNADQLAGALKGLAD
jgi:transketolase